MLEIKIKKEIHRLPSRNLKLLCFHCLLCCGCCHLDHIALWDIYGESLHTVTFISMEIIQISHNIVFLHMFSDIKNYYLKLEFYNKMLV